MPISGLKNNTTMINLTETLQYDTTLSFEEQSPEVQAYINQQMQAESEKTTNTFCGRTEKETWNCDTYTIERRYNYLAPESAANCFALANNIIIVKEV